MNNLLYNDAMNPYYYRQPAAYPAIPAQALADHGFISALTRWDRPNIYYSIYYIYM